MLYSHAISTTAGAEYIYLGQTQSLFLRETILGELTPAGDYLAGYALDIGCVVLSVSSHKINLI